MRSSFHWSGSAIRELGFLDQNQQASLLIFEVPTFLQNGNSQNSHGSHIIKVNLEICDC